MSTVLRVLFLAPLLAAGAAALTGCTAGEITKPDGSPAAVPSFEPMTVTFQRNKNGVEDPKGDRYTVNATQAASGSVTFSFDPFVAGSATNGGVAIPAGDYAVIVTGLLKVNPGSPFSGDAYYVNPHVTVAYNGYCSDSNTNNSVPCALFHLILCDYQAGDVDKYGSLCTNVTTSGLLTTVGLTD